MNSTLFLSSFLLALTCSCASHSNDRDDDDDDDDAKVAMNAPAGAAAAQQLPPAPISAATTIAFDQDKPGELPAGWRAEGTNQSGPVATWKVTADATAPSKPNVLTLASTNHSSGSTFKFASSKAQG